MKNVKKFILVLVSIVVIITIIVMGYILYQKPKYEGELLIKKIQNQTTVYFDDFGVPHIYATTQKDAMTVLGYVHAQDRLWQMELLRRIAPGRLSEMFGSKLLKTDSFFVGLGIDENSQKAIEKLDKNSESYQLAMAYIEGVNQYIDEGKMPIEFQILGLKKDKFTFGFNFVLIF